VDTPAKSSEVGGVAGGLLEGASVVWAGRVVWLLTAVLGGGAIGEALAPHDRPVQLVGTSLAWAAWGAVALALLVPSTVSLTVVRSVVPAGVVVSVLAAIALAADGTDAVVVAAVSIALAALSTAVVMSGGFGEAFAQASAYGDERRFVLRPPIAFLVPAVLSWCVLCATAITGPLVLAAGNWLLGVPLTVAVPALAWFLGRRFHRLSRRWLVLVPAGVVIHDPLVLGETAMFARPTVVAMGLALADTEAADLTGPASGHAVEIELRAMETVVLAPTRDKPNGTALHVRSMLVAPTRPGRLLRHAAERRIPVG
jgi:hypothetical protein